MNLKKFTFNPFQVNTYVLYDDSKEAVIIDPGCSDGVELLELIDFLKENDLKAVKLLYTHTHIDHVIGSIAVSEQFDILPEAHAAGKVFLDHSTETAANYGFDLDRNPEISSYLNEGEDVCFGNSKLEVLYTPGHADGSVCFYSKADGFIIVGDVLFNMSIGRTDFPTGDFDLLKKNIFEKLFTLADNTIVYSGHGPETNIGFEKTNNPFLVDDNAML